MNEQTQLAEWAKAVKQRVGIKCVKCGATKGLNAHHLYCKVAYPEKRFDVENGTVLCDTCHARFHSIYGRGNNTAEQFTEFVETDYYDKGNVHVRLYILPLQEGLMAGLSGEAWKVYLGLLAYIDKDYRCYPSQSHLAGLLGVSRATVNRRLQELCDYRWQDEPLITKVINKNRGAFTNNVYYINPAFVEIY
jgi:hypothetical protein